MRSLSQFSHFSGNLAIASKLYLRCIRIIVTSGQFLQKHRVEPMPWSIYRTMVWSFYSLGTVTSINARSLPALAVICSDFFAGKERSLFSHNVVIMRRISNSPHSTQRHRQTSNTFNHKLYEALSSLLVVLWPCDVTVSHSSNLETTHRHRGGPAGPDYSPTSLRSYQRLVTTSPVSVGSYQ